MIFDVSEQQMTVNAVEGDIVVKKRSCDGEGHPALNKVIP